MILLLLFLVPVQDSLPAHPGDISPPALRSHSAPSPKRASLPGGAELLVIEDPSLPLVDGSLVFRVGSVFDPDGKAGLAVLAADCMREGGSKSSSGAALDAWLDLRAATLELLPAGETLTLQFSCASEDLDELLRRIMDLVRSPAFPPEALALAKQRARTRVAREEDDAAVFADALLLQVAYGSSSPWARRPTMTSIDAVEREDLLTWHASHIGPNRLIAGVTGDVSAVPFAEHMTELFEAWEVVPPPPLVPAPVFNVPARTTIHLFDRPGLPQAELRFAGPGLRRLHPDYASLLLWSDVVGIGGATNRMMVRLRTELGLAYTVGTYFRPGWEHSGRLIGFIGTRNEAVGTALASMLEVLRQSTDPFDAVEFADALERHRNAEVFLVDTPRKVLDRAMLLTLHGYPEDFWEKNWGRLATLDSEEVAAAARRHIDATRLVAVAVGPAEVLERELQELGDVVRLDRAPGAADPTEWLTQLFDSIGPRTEWAEASGVEYLLEMTSRSVGAPTTRSHLWISFEDASSRTETQIAGADMKVVIGPNAGWARTPTTVTEYPPDLCERVRVRVRANIYRVLHLLAVDAMSDLSLDEAGRLEGTLPNGGNFTLEAGEHGHPVSLTILVGNEERTTRYFDWSEAGGVKFAKRSTREEPAVDHHQSGFVLHETLDPQLFEQP